MARFRYGGTPDALMDVLLPFASDRSFVRYCEAERVADATVHVALIEQHHGLLHALYKVQPNLSFRKDTVEACMSALVEKQGPSWQLSLSDYTDWAETMCRRLRNLCHVVSQGVNGHPKCLWVRALPWKSGAKEGLGSDNINQDKTNPTYIFGFDAELRQAWRQVVGSPSARKELTSDLSAPPGAKDTDPIQAPWPDGAKAIINDVLCHELEAVLKIKTSTGSCDLWVGEHCQSHNKLRVCKRADRVPLVVLYEQKRQVLQMREDSGGKGNTDDVVLAMIKIAKLYSEDAITKTELHEKKNKFIEETKKKNMKDPKVEKKKSEATTTKCKGIEKETAKAEGNEDATPIMQKPATSRKSKKKKKRTDKDTSSEPKKKHTAKASNYQSCTEMAGDISHHESGHSDDSTLPFPPTSSMAEAVESWSWCLGRSSKDGPDEASGP